jgi:hypothetical protein
MVGLTDLAIEILILRFSSDRAQAESQRSETPASARKISSTNIPAIEHVGRHVGEGF